jgi:hypothetical protein
MRVVMMLCVALLALPHTAWAASMYITPESGKHGVSDTFIAEVRLDNANECINAVHVEVQYPKDALKAVDFSKGGSILSLWVEEPQLDTQTGAVTFSGGIPGGYCGRIQGDPVLSNVLGKIIFSVVGAGVEQAEISISDQSVVYLNDGAATKAELMRGRAVYSISATPQAQENPWIASVQEDDVPPDPFVITIESTRGVFRGNYYAVFSTIDKQSGLDHFEIFERGVWQRVSSPHELTDQLLLEDISIKAIDKAGNERIGTYVPGSQAPRAPREVDFSILILAGVALLLGGGYAYVRYRKTPDSA